MLPEQAYKDLAPQFKTFMASPEFTAVLLQWIRAMHRVQVEYRTDGIQYDGSLEAYAVENLKADATQNLLSEMESFITDLQFKKEGMTHVSY